VSKEGGGDEDEEQEHEQERGGHAGRGLEKGKRGRKGRAHSLAVATAE
jgi:hypothetical protein